MTQTKEPNAKEIQLLAWERFMASRWEYMKRGWVDPFFAEQERRWNELIQVEPEPEPLPQAVKPEARDNSRVYFLLDQTPMSDGDYRIKIGNGDPERRKQATTLPHLIIVWQEDGGREREKQLHKLFIRDRIAGSEWFRLSEDIRGYLQEKSPGCLAHLETEPVKQVGRPQDVPTEEELVFLIKNPDISNKELYRRFRWRNEKAKRYKEYAHTVASQLAA